MRSQIVIILLCLTTIVLGQDTTVVQQNPFELEQLRGKTKPILQNPGADLNIPTSATSSANNPFEVNHIPIRKNQISRNTDQAKDAKPFYIEHFPLIVLIGLLIFLAGILTKQREILSNILSAGIRDYALTDFLKSENDGKSIMVRLAGVFSILSASFFITLTCSEYVDLSVWWLFGYTVLGILVWYSLKETIISILRYAFSVKSVSIYYLAQIKVWNILLGLALLFFSIFIAYGPETIANLCIYLGLAVIGLCWIAKLLKVMAYSLPTVFNQPLQFFIYLCAFEISPILMLVRFLHIA